MPVRITKELNGYSMEITSKGESKTYVFNRYKDMVKRMADYFGHPKEPIYDIPVEELPPPPPPVVKRNLLEY